MGQFERLYKVGWVFGSYFSQTSLKQPILLSDSNGDKNYSESDTYLKAEKLLGQTPVQNAREIHSSDSALVTTKFSQDFRELMIVLNNWYKDISYNGDFLLSLIVPYIICTFKTSVDFSSHWYVTSPGFGMKTDILRFEWSE